jgi:nucleoside-triphosphatase THEP1
VAARLHDEGVRVAGFVQVPRRTSSRVSGYDLQRLGSKTRLPLARRRAPGGAGPVLAYSSFQFQVESFARARAWLVRDARRAEVLVLDGISTREADGGGHFEALAWASRLSTPLLVVACVRRDRIAAVVDKLGLAGRVVDLLDTNEAVAGPAAIERAIVAAVRA